MSVPQFLLGSSVVLCVFQLRLQGLQLLSQVPAVFLSLDPGLSLQLQVLLQFRQLSLQLTDLFLGHVLLGRLLLNPLGKDIKMEL